MREALLGRKRAQGTRRWLMDFVLALGLFWIVVFVIGGGQDGAHAVPLPSIVEQNQAAAAALHDHHAIRYAIDVRAARASQSNHTRSMLLLSVTFAALAALNLAFWRHLRRVYASPRRGVWRRG